jgi:hypothetical protein
MLLSSKFGADNWQLHHAAPSPGCAGPIHDPGPFIYCGDIVSEPLGPMFGEAVSPHATAFCIGFKSVCELERSRKSGVAPSHVRPVEDAVSRHTLWVRRCIVKKHRDRLTTDPSAIKSIAVWLGAYLVSGRG